MNECPICARGEPLGVIAELDATWAAAGVDEPVPGYVSVVSKRHVVEPFELPAAEMDAFWREAMLVARAVAEVVQPAKMNYEIHGNTIPHLHMHLLPREPRGETAVVRLAEAIATALRAAPTRRAEP